VITDEEQRLIWNTATLNAFNNAFTDDVLYESNIEGTEQFIKVYDDHIDGFKCKKRHKGNATATVYFIRTQDAAEMPIKILDTEKVRYKNNVYMLVTSYKSLKITPEKHFSFKQMVDLSGMPSKDHSNPKHYTLYKMKRLFARIYGQMYGRIVTESAFGKDKYAEAINLLIEKPGGVILNDPTRAKIFYAACHNEDITINELPDDADKQTFNKFCNQIMRIGDGTKVLDNSARSTGGTTEQADVSRLSVFFTHNVPKYYIDKGKRHFDEIYPYNVINRYYYNHYEGHLLTKFPYFDPVEVAKNHKEFIVKWLKSFLWYSENIGTLLNDMEMVCFYTFRKKEQRFLDHFELFCKAIKLYSNGCLDTQNDLTAIEYESHKDYERLVEC